MKKAFDEGWGGVICKTLSLDASKVVNVTPRYAKKKGLGGEVIGWENIELISDRPFETMLAEMKQLKEEYPDRVLIASIMVWAVSPAEALLCRAQSSLLNPRNTSRTRKARIERFVSVVAPIQDKPLPCLAARTYMIIAAR